MSFQHDISSASVIDLNALEIELTALAGHLNLRNFRLLEVLAEFDRHEGYIGTGCVSSAHWLSSYCGISLVAARENVRVARALANLPLVADAMRRGVLSYCKVRALTRIATVENERWLLSIAERGTVSQLEKVVRFHRRRERSEKVGHAGVPFVDRHLQCHVVGSGAVVLKGRLAPEQGAAVLKALQEAADVLRTTERDSRESVAASDARKTRASRNADALALVAEMFVAQRAAALVENRRSSGAAQVNDNSRGSYCPPTPYSQSASHASLRGLGGAT